MNDQASSLRKMMKNSSNKSKENNIQENVKNIDSKTRVIAVASGKGGVGKTNLSVNLAYALSDMDKNVLVMDADIGMANVDIVMGLTSTYSLKHVMEGKCKIEDAIVKTPSGINVLTGISGEEDFIDVSSDEVQRLLAASSHLQENYDIIIIDIGAGAHPDVLNFIMAADETLIVLTPEPTAIMDAYSLLKILSNHNYRSDLGLVVNMVENNNEGEEVIERMKGVIKEYLDINLKLTSNIPYDKKVVKSVKKQQSIFNLYPNSSVVKSYKNTAARIIDKEEETSSQNMKSFFSRIVGMFKKG